jgi:hypothetical protein
MAKCSRCGKSGTKGETCTEIIVSGNGTVLCGGKID